MKHPSLNLVERPNFFTNYKRNLNTITPSACWTYESLLTQKTCDMAPFFNGVDSTQAYIEQHFPYDSTLPILYPPTEEGCKQVVLGTFELIAPYFYYNKYVSDKFILLAAKHWSEKLNQEYVSCAFQMLLHNASCQFPVRVLLPNDLSRLVRTNRSPRITLFELCIVLQQSNRFKVYEYPMEGYPYRMYFMKHIPGTGGRRTMKRKTRKNRSLRMLKI